jgi:hypothetical protein
MIKFIAFVFSNAGRSLILVMYNNLGSVSVVLTFHGGFLGVVSFGGIVG